MPIRKMYYKEWSELSDQYKEQVMKHGKETWMEDENGAYVVVPVGIME